MRELRERIEMMRKVLKKLTSWLRQVNEEHRSVSHLPHERPRLYPFRFMSRQEKRAHQRKTDLHLSLHMYY